jgi:hypothetical protein
MSVQDKGENVKRWILAWRRSYVWQRRAADDLSDFCLISRVSCFPDLSLALTCHSQPYLSCRGGTSGRGPATRQDGASSTTTREARINCISSCLCQFACRSGTKPRFVSAPLVPHHTTLSIPDTAWTEEPESLFRLSSTATVKYSSFFQICAQI